MNLHKLLVIEILIIFVAISIVFPLTAQPKSLIEKVGKDLFMHNYTVKDGLSESIVNTILKDSRGLVWIGTEGGLNKFNAYTFEVFQEDTSLYSISHSRIHAIVEDEFGNIWIGTDDGLNKYLPEVNGFQPKIKAEHDLIRKIIYDPHRKSLWLAMANQGLVEYHIPSDTFKTNSLLQESIIVNSVIQINQDSLVVGTQENGIFLLNLHTGKSRQIDVNSSPVNITNNQIKALGKTSKYLIVGTNRGLNLLDLEKNTTEVFSKSRGNFSSDLIFCVEVDKEGYIWVGTDGGGINKINSSNLSLVNYSKKKFSENGLQTDVIKAIYADDNQNVWIGTYKFGFGIHTKKTSFLNNISLGAIKDLDLKNTSVTAFSPIDNETIYIGTDGGGLLKWDGKIFDKIALDAKCKNCFEEKILCMEKDKKGNLWIGTFADGLYCLKTNGQVLHFKKGKSKDLTSNNIWEIKKDGKGNLWMATETGLTKLSLDGYQFKSFLPYVEGDQLAGLELRSLSIDQNGMMWIGSFSGLYGFNIITEKFEKRYSTETAKAPLISNFIISIYQDDSGNLWLGTYGNGLQVFNPYQEEILYENLTQTIGNQMAFFVIGDKNQHIWAGTNVGIVTIHPEEKNFFWFNTNNGLQDVEYNMNAVKQINDSILIAGGTKGFVLMNTNQSKVQEANHEVILEEINYENKFLPFNPYKHPNLLPEFKIDYSKSSLNIHFAALDFANSQNIRYSYLLENFDKSWSKPTDLRHANYTNIPPGTYYFKIKTTDQSMNEKEAQTLARIVVKPAWWMSIWFKVALAVLLVGMILLVTKIRDNQLKKSKVNLIKAVSEKTKEIERQKEEIEHKKFEIELRNNELIEQNRELQHMNEELNTQKETINDQRSRLEKAHNELQNINSELEEIVTDRTSELNNTIKELNKTISELDRFVYSASHDLGAPLKSILGLVNIAQLETSDQNIKPHLDYMKESVHKLEDVIQSLIQYSRNNRLELHPAEIKLAKFIGDSFDALKFMPGYGNIRFENEISESEKVITDENRLRMIVRNLLSNAIKYSDPEKNEQWIKVRYEDVSESKWQLIVEDNGLGIDENHLEKIFRMFYRASESSDGSGLGLYIAKEAITKLNGKVLVKSTLRQGTSIFVTLGKHC